MKVLVKLYYCIIKINKEKILAIKDKQMLMHEIRNNIMPNCFSNQDNINKLFNELNKHVKVSDISAKV